MAKNLQFMDCPHCGKRMVTTAAMCGHCRKSPAKKNRETENRNREEEESLDGEEQAGGGYAEDEWSYEEYLEREFPDSSKRAKGFGWVQWTAIVLLIALLLPLLVNLFAAASRR